MGAGKEDAAPKAYQEIRVTAISSGSGPRPLFCVGCGKKLVSPGAGGLFISYGQFGATCGDCGLKLDVRVTNKKADAGKGEDGGG